VRHGWNHSADRTKRDEIYYIHTHRHAHTDTHTHISTHWIRLTHTHTHTHIEIHTHSVKQIAVLMSNTDMKTAYRLSAAQKQHQRTLVNNTLIDRVNVINTPTNQRTSQHSRESALIGQVFLCSAACSCWNTRNINRFTSLYTRHSYRFVLNILNDDDDDDHQPHQQYTVYEKYCK